MPGAQRPTGEREPLLDAERGGWGPPPPQKGAAESLKGGKPAETDASLRSCMGVFYSASASALAIPFLVGSWCWPVLLATMTGVAFSHTAVVLSHTLQFAMLMAVFTNLVQYYVYLGRSQRQGTHLQRYGPAYMVLFATFLVMVHPTYIVLNDAHVGQASRPSKQFVKACTYGGYGLMTFAAFWAAEIVSKVKFACCGDRVGCCVGRPQDDHSA